MDILQRISEIRTAKGMSVYELAQKSGISKNTIYRWYSKNYTPTLDSLQVICEKGLEISLVEFFAIDTQLIPATPELKEIVELWMNYPIDKNKQSNKCCLAINQIKHNKQKSGYSPLFYFALIQSDI